MKDYKTSTEPGSQVEIPVPKMSKQDILNKILKLKLEHPYHPGIQGLQQMLDRL